MLAKVFSSAVLGIDAFPVEVEVDISYGLPYFTLVGLPEASVRESKDRVRTSMNNSGYKFPDDKITVNLAPADIKKEGTGFDLPIAAGILSSMNIIPGSESEEYLFLGELSLDGRIKPVRGALPASIAAKEKGLKGVILPAENSLEAAVVQGLNVYPVAHLSDVVSFFRGEKIIEPAVADISTFINQTVYSGNDFSEILGQEHVKRAMEVAAAGSHNILMSGSPGSGKTMLARRLPTILPPVTLDEAIEITKIFSVSGLLEKNMSLVKERPYRSPHHTISDAGLIGGGHNPRPGEVSLSHNGVLFLDEFPEFKKHVLEVLRQPLEDGKVTISRAATSVTYPSSFMLVGAMNPCPCGYLNDANHNCRCTPTQVQRYRSKLSGPLLDRIDIHIDVPAVPFSDIMKNEGGSEKSEDIRKRVTEARDIQNDRFKRSKIFSNSQMENRHLKKYCVLEADSKRLLETAVTKLGLSARAYNRIIKIARTIADLAGEDNIGIDHVSEAVQYRDFDRQGV